MATEPLTSRARARPVENLDRGILRALDHPVAFVATGALLVALFGWTFFTNPNRVAPTKDPAYYTWRTEALLSEEPITLLEIEGPKVGGAGGMYASGYRVAAPILGSFLRRVGGVGVLSTTAVLMVGVPALTALLLAGFAYQQRRDPLIFHAVALGTGSLYLTPPFVGYLDNILALCFLAASLLFIEATRRSWPARFGFAICLVLCGLTHPTTLVIFCGVLGLMAGVRLVTRRFALRSVIRDDGPMLVAGFLAAVVTGAIWTVGIWGRSVSLGEAALPPPYESSFFVDRLMLWVGAMRPLLNGPLFVIGVVGLLLAGRNAAENELSRVALVWLAPLVGLFGFAIGQTYPYYRFFNTTLAWVLLVGVGLFFALRFFVDLSRRGGAFRLALLGVVALGFIVATNFTTGFETSGWNNAAGGWLSVDTRADLDLLRDALAAEGEPRPVIFVVDSEDTSPRVYGSTKLAGNTARFGLPRGWIDEGYLYLGSLNNFVSGVPTSVGQETYDDVSLATLSEAHAAVEESGDRPIVVLASAFNDSRSNEVLLGAAKSEDLSEYAREFDLWVLDRGDIEMFGAEGRVEPGFFERVPARSGSDLVHLARVVGGFLLLLLPGALAFRWFLRDGEFAEAVGLAPALSMALLALVGMVVLAVIRSPFTATVGWGALGITVALAAVVGLRSSHKRFTFVRSRST